jgi:DNA-binding LacI/PurR family transcriptional regulator
MPRRKPTIHDVAARAGVSKSLVSLALRGSEKVSVDSRLAIEAAAAELGYRPNAAARSLADRRSRAIGVLVLDFNNPIFAQILDGVQQVAGAQGYNTLIVTGSADPIRQESELARLLEFQVEGIILIAHRLTANTIMRISDERPIAIITRRDVTGPNIDTVSNDDRSGAIMAVEYLVSLGHSRIAHITGGDNQIARDRELGYLDAMTSAGLPQHINVIPGDFTDSRGYRAAQELLTAAPDTTAAFVANDLSALGAMAAIEELGRQVPEDFSVIGYDGMALATLRTLNLTTVQQPLIEMGRLAVTNLLKRIDNPNTQPVEMRVDSQLHIAGTCGPPKT